MGFNMFAYYILWYFVIYSFLGWCLEVAYAALKTGRLINRGFLNGPVCPIYGVGMTGILLISYLTMFPMNNLPLLFLGGMLLTTAIELFGGWILDTMFHMRWWDYRSQPHNFKGYICLRFSIIWGLGVVFIMKLLHPLVEHVVELFSFQLGVTLLAVILAVFLADFLVTLQTVIGMTEKVGELEKVAEKLRSVSDELTQLLGNAVLDTSERLEEHKQDLEQWRENEHAVWVSRREELEAKKEELERLGQELSKKLQAGAIFGSGRLLRAFPHVRRSKSGEKLLMEIQQWTSNLWKEKKE